MWVESSHMRLMSLLKEATEELPWSFRHLRTQWEFSSLRQEEVLTRAWPCWHLILDFQPSELREINFCCLYATLSVAFRYSSPNRLKHYVIAIVMAMILCGVTVQNLFFQILTHKAYSEAFIGSSLYHCWKLSNSCFWWSDFCFLWYSLQSFWYLFSFENRGMSNETLKVKCIWHEVIYVAIAILCCY